MALKNKIIRKSGVNFFRCFQCQMCHNGCPFVPVMDYAPNQLIRLLQLNKIEDALNSSTIWICVGCNACVSYCPMKIDIPAIMTTLRSIVIEENIVPKEPDILEFHRLILSSIKKYGRVHELEVMLGFKFKKRKIFEDILLGLQMLAKKKLNIHPSKIKEIKKIEKFF